MVKRREFLITGVCTVGTLLVARSLLASPEPGTHRNTNLSSPRYHLHGCARTGCARIPEEEQAWDTLIAAVPVR